MATAARKYDLYSHAFRASRGLEAEIALGTLLSRLSGLRLAVQPEEIRWRPMPLFRSLVALPVAWD